MPGQRNSSHIAPGGQLAKTMSTAALCSRSALAWTSNLCTVQLTIWLRLPLSMETQVLITGLMVPYSGPTSRYGGLLRSSTSTLSGGTSISISSELNPSSPNTDGTPITHREDGARSTTGLPRLWPSPRNQSWTPRSSISQSLMLPLTPTRVAIATVHGLELGDTTLPTRLSSMILFSPGTVSFGFLI